MPRIYLASTPLRFNFAPQGALALDPNQTGLSRVLLRHLTCLLRCESGTTRTPVLQEAVVDTGAPLTYFPRTIWETDFGWREGTDYERLNVPGVSHLRGSVLGFGYDFRLVRLIQPIEVVSLRPPFPALARHSVIAQLDEGGGPPFILLGLWGNVLEGTNLRFLRRHASDDIDPVLEF